MPLLVLDLSGQLVSGELTTLASRYAGGNAARYVLPQDLDQCGLLARLSGPQFADAIAEAIHAGTPGGARADPGRRRADPAPAHRRAGG